METIGAIRTTAAPSSERAYAVTVTTASAGSGNAPDRADVEEEPLTPLARHFRTVVYDDIVTAFVFKERVDVERLRADVAESVCKHPRFRSCLPDPPIGKRHGWAPVDQVDLSWHVVEEPESMVEEEDDGTILDGQAFDDLAVELSDDLCSDDVDGHDADVISNASADLAPSAVEQSARQSNSLAHGMSTTGTQGESRISSAENEAPASVKGAEAQAAQSAAVVETGATPASAVEATAASLAAQVAANAAQGGIAREAAVLLPAAAAAQGGIARETAVLLPAAAAAPSSAVEAAAVPTAAAVQTAAAVEAAAVLSAAAPPPPAVADEPKPLLGCSMAAQRVVERYEALLMDDKRPRLTFDRPLWRIYLVHVRRGHTANGRSADYSFAVFRVNHAIGDLASLVALFKDMTTPLSSQPHCKSRRDAPSPVAPQEPWQLNGSLLVPSNPTPAAPVAAVAPTAAAAAGVISATSAMVAAGGSPTQPPTVNHDTNCSCIAPSKASAKPRVLPLSHSDQDLAELALAPMSGGGMESSKDSSVPLDGRGKVLSREPTGATTATTVAACVPERVRWWQWMWITVVYLYNTMWGLLGFVMMALLPDSRTCFFNGQRVQEWGRSKDGAHLPAAVGFTQPMDIKEINRIRKKMNATLNDFMVACIAGGMERYLLHTGEWDGKSPLKMHAGCPVDLRAKFGSTLKAPAWWSSYDGPGSSLRGPWGNNTGFIFVTLPIFGDRKGVDVGRETARVADLKRQFDCKKRSLDPMLFKAVPDIFGVPLPARLIERINNSVYKLFSVSLSNIQGPRERVCWAGYEVEDFFTLSYGPIDMALTLQIFSYAGTVRVGYASLKYFLERPQLFGKCIHDAYLQLQEESR